MGRRTWLVAVVIALLALPAALPAAAADGSAGAGQGQKSVRVASGSGLEVEAERGWCATAVPCASYPGSGVFYTGPARAAYAEADAYRYDGSKYGTPDEIYGECDQYWTDAAGVAHIKYAWVDALLSNSQISHGSLVWLMNSGAESNTQAMAVINAAGFSGNGALTIQGFGTFNNDTDMPFTNSGFTVTIVGLIHYATLINGQETMDYAVPGSITCQTNPLPENGLFAPFQFQFDLYGEAEVEPGRL